MGAALLCILALPAWMAELLERGDSWRIYLWQHYLSLSLDRPLLGYGLDFDASFQVGSTTIHTPHNILLSALIRGGLGAFLSLTVALLAMVWATVSAARRGWWQPATVLVAVLAITSVDHEILPDAFNHHWFLFWLPFSLTTASTVYEPA